MMMRFLPAPIFAVSTSLFGAACNRVSEPTDIPVSSQSSSGTVPFSTPPDPAHQWDSLISGNPGLPASVTTLLRNGADEEALARNPRISLEEGVPATVSQARHQRRALGYYNESLRLLDSCGNDCAPARTRLRQKTAILSLSLEGLDGMNRRIGSD